MEFGEYLRFFFALGFVLVLIAGLAAVVRRSGFGERLAATPSSAGERRLYLVEVRPLDAKRKLVLIRRDDREHLVLLGAASDLLIESDIPAAPGKPVERETAGPVPAERGLAARLTAKLKGQAS
jgi:flagellar protein FliO/FliZ